MGSRDVLDVALVRPELVAEVSADRAVDRGGVLRHPMRFKRLAECGRAVVIRSA
ncbi:hypothetical protein [Streptomyces sp. NPDC051577]|uniref:hypothetical protein n=1 Tax=Streptomyces sp. NPDC051577 TaxID=3155166 RepID=UPI0034497354